MGVRCGAAARFSVSGSSRPATVGIAGRLVLELRICCALVAEARLAGDRQRYGFLFLGEIAAYDQGDRPVRPQPARRAAGRNGAAWPLAETTTSPDCDKTGVAHRCSRCNG